MTIQFSGNSLPSISISISTAGISSGDVSAGPLGKTWSGESGSVERVVSTAVKIQTN